VIQAAAIRAIAIRAETNRMVITEAIRAVIMTRAITRAAAMATTATAMILTVMTVPTREIATTGMDQMRMVQIMEAAAAEAEGMVTTNK
jgi:hypothetical protein